MWVIIWDRKTINEFIDGEIKLLLKDDYDKRFFDSTNILLFLDPLKIIQETLSQEFDYHLSQMLTHIAQATAQDIDSIFAAVFLERKVLINFKTVEKVLEEYSKIVCLLLALVK